MTSPGMLFACVAWAGAVSSLCCPWSVDPEPFQGVELMPGFESWVRDWVKDASYFALTGAEWWFDEDLSVAGTTHLTQDGSGHGLAAFRGWNLPDTDVDVLVPNSSVSSAGLNCHFQCSVGIGLCYVWNVSTVLQPLDSPKKRTKRPEPQPIAIGKQNKAVPRPPVSLAFASRLPSPSGLLATLAPAKLLPRPLPKPSLAARTPRIRELPFLYQPHTPLAAKDLARDDFFPSYEAGRAAEYSPKAG